MAVRLRGEARIRVAEDPLHRRHIGAAHEEQRRSRVTKVMESDRSNLARRPELHLAAWAASQLVVLGLLDERASPAPALVQPGVDDPRTVERAAQHELELHAL
ncbi:MAG TPA: hypothetical protein VHK47_01980 [Polyangia bacterium]|nr:hypothetical protein [Polyangia bacterium]